MHKCGYENMYEYGYENLDVELDRLLVRIARPSPVRPEPIPIKRDYDQMCVIFQEENHRELLLEKYEKSLKSKKVRKFINKMRFIVSRVTHPDSPLRKKSSVIATLPKESDIKVSTKNHREPKVASVKRQKEKRNRDSDRAFTMVRRAARTEKDESL